MLQVLHRRASLRDLTLQHASYDSLSDEQQQACMATSLVGIKHTAANGNCDRATHGLSMCIVAARAYMQL